MKDTTKRGWQEGLILDNIAEPIALPQRLSKRLEGEINDEDLVHLLVTVSQIIEAEQGETHDTITDLPEITGAFLVSLLAPRDLT